MIILALDYGEKRIGVAFSDSLGKFAHIRPPIIRNDEKNEIERIVSIAREIDAEKIIIGLPVSLNGKIGISAKKVKAFGEIIEKYSGIKVEYFDERLSTVEAEKILIKMGENKTKRKKLIDSLSAKIFLQTYLDKIKNDEKYDKN